MVNSLSGIKENLVETVKAVELACHREINNTISITNKFEYSTFCKQNPRRDAECTEIEYPEVVRFVVAEFII